MKYLMIAPLLVLTACAATANNPQQQYGVNFEQIEKAVEIYNARNG